MEFGFDKCAKRGKLLHSQNLILDSNREIQKLEQGKTYEYLGTEETEGVHHQQIKERLKKELQEIKNDTEIQAECQE